MPSSPSLSASRAAAKPPSAVPSSEIIQAQVPTALAGAPIREVERMHLERTLALTDGNRTHAAELLGLDPQHCIFVDDIQANITAAEQVGFTGVLHSEADATVERVAELLGRQLAEVTKPTGRP